MLPRLMIKSFKLSGDLPWAAMFGRTDGILASLGAKKYCKDCFDTGLFKWVTWLEPESCPDNSPEVETQSPPPPAPRIWPG